MIYAKDNKIININKDVIINGIVKGGRKYASIEDLNKLDIYEVIEPTIESNQKRGAMYFDAENKVYTYYVETKDKTDYENGFDSQKAEQDVYDIFTDEREATLLPYQYNLVQNLGVRNFHKLKQLADLMFYIDKVVTQSEYDAYFDVFTLQNINLTEY